MTFLAFALLFNLAFHCQGMPSVGKDDTYLDDYSSDDYSSDDYYSDNGDYLNEHEKVVHTTPTFTSTGTNQLVNEGDTIKLPCFVDKLDGFVLLWKKGKDIVTVGQQLIDKSDTRIKLEETAQGNTLVISLAEPADAGEYSCQVSTNSVTELRHSVRIRVAPVIRPVPQDGRLIVHQGEPASLSCDIIRGNPTPEITWRRKERKMPSGEEEIRGLSITFTETSRHHSGIYTCSADNGFGRPTNSTIVLDVQHAPIVETEQTFIHTNENDETEVICTVHASPRAEVVWFKNGVPLSKDEGIFTHRGSRHSILLTGIKESTFGVYKCKATNKFGSDEKTTEVSGKAAPVNFKSEPMGTQERSHHLEWVAESITPITNFKLQYKEDYYHHPNAIEDDSSSWTEIQVNPQNNGDHFYSGKLTLDKLTPATRYLARVSSKNDYGYSELSQPFKFATKGVPVQQPSTQDGDSGVMISCSIGLMLSTVVMSISCWRLLHHQ